MVVELDQPGIGRVRQLGSPIALSRTPASIERPAPELGADSEEVLASIGYGPEEIAELKEEGVI